MNSRLSWVSFLALIVMNASCSGNEGNGQESGASPPPESETAVTTHAVSVPVISARSYVGGSAKVTVTGSFQVDEDILINTQASYSDGEMTWLQYGASGSEAPNALVTISLDEVGINVGRGKPTATISAENCTGGMDVTGNSIKGHYTCPNVTSYDPGSGKMGNVNIEIDLTGTS
jgi:hypothetical protein